MLIDSLVLNSSPDGQQGRDRDRDRWTRSVVKSVSWRLVGTLDTVLISYLITGKLALALSIGSVELVTKMVLYVLHERAWERIKWGR